jgi:hypothetical protein
MRTAADPSELGFSYTRACPGHWPQRQAGALCHPQLTNRTSHLLAWLGHEASELPDIAA